MTMTDDTEENWYEELGLQEIKKHIQYSVLHGRDKTFTKRVRDMAISFYKHSKGGQFNAAEGPGLLEGNANKGDWNQNSPKGSNKGDNSKGDTSKGGDWNDNSKGGKGGGNWNQNKGGGGDWGNQNQWGNQGWKGQGGKGQGW